MLEGEEVVGKVRGMSQLRVRLDNYSHQSGHRRAFVRCKKHFECQKWVFCKNFKSTNHAVAYLLAWSSDAMQFPYDHQSDAHREHVPSEDLQKFCYKEQFGGRW